MARSLDEVVTAVATSLMGVNAATSAAVSQRVLADLVGHFGVDFSFLRHNDHTIRATRLIAEWPVRPEIPDPDPIGVVYFADADPVFAAAETAKEILVFRPEPATDDYQKTIEEGTGIPSTSMAVVPMLSGDVTTGCLGFVKIGDREWLPDELNALKAIASLFAQLQARIVAEDQLRFLAEHDDLTGLNNRRALIAHLDSRLAAGQPGPVSALFLDLDRLKAINDYLGHTAGDWFIRVFAKRLEEGAEGPNLIARLGGDEFVVVPAAPMSAAEAENLANALQATLRERVSIDGEMLTRTVSIGVALGVPGRDTTSDLLRRADQALLAAKSGGGNKIAVFSDDMSLKGEFRNDIELHLQSAIENGALILHYLPEVDMRTGEILAFEALVRWQHPSRGLLSPNAFIGVAESINFAGELGRWVMRLRRISTVAGQGHRRGRRAAAQRVSRAAGHRGFRRDGRGHHRRVRPGRRLGLPGDHRKRGRAGHRDDAHHPGRAQGSRRPDRHRRLRHRLQRAVTPEVAPGGHTEDRQEFCPRTRHQPRRPGDRARGDRARRVVRARVGGPGRRDPRGRTDPAAARLPPRAGLPAVPAGGR